MHSKLYRPPFLNLSRISSAARLVPAPPAQPLVLSHLTNLGVTHAVNPTLTGKNRVLCTVYANTSMAYKPSEPPDPCPPLIGSISSLPGSAGLDEIWSWTKPLTASVILCTCSAPIRLIPAKATVKSSVERMMYTPRAYHPYDLIRCLRRCDRVASGGNECEEGDVGDGGVVLLRRAVKLENRRDLLDLGVFVRAEVCRVRERGRIGAVTLGRNDRTPGTRSRRTIDKGKVSRRPKCFRHSLFKPLSSRH
jgi:hypothetical protein